MKRWGIMFSLMLTAILVILVTVNHVDASSLMSFEVVPSLLPASNVEAVTLTQNTVDSSDSLISPVQEGKVVRVAVLSSHPVEANSETDVPPSLPEQAPALLQSGVGCVSGSIIDRYHQSLGAGLSVEATSGNQTETAVTNAMGQFKFENLANGTWTIKLADQVGWQPVTPMQFEVTVDGANSTCLNVRFKLERLPCLIVTKLDAHERSGSYQKIGLPDWQISIRGPGQSEEKMTDGTGQATFENLVPGTWTVTEASVEGWRPVAGETSEKTVHLQSPRKAGYCHEVTFVNQQVHDGCIQVKKLDEAKMPLAWWKMTLSRVDGTQAQRVAHTDNNGVATFTQVPLGDWIVTEEVKPNWQPLSPNSMTQTVTLTKPGHCEVVTFTNQRLGCIDGYKINHLGHGLAGWKVTATNAAGEMMMTTTDAQGYFVLDNLTLGTWTLEESLQPGWEAVTAAKFDVEVTMHGQCHRVRFKNRTEFACLDVYKHDSYDNVGLPGWKITVNPAFGGAAVSGETDGTGHVRFSNLAPGQYQVSEEMQEGWVPVTATSKQITLEASGTCGVVTFINAQKQTYVPVAPTKPHQPWSTPGCRTKHTVKWGQTLSGIAYYHGTTVWAIKQANGLRSDWIFTGQHLCIP